MKYNYRISQIKINPGWTPGDMEQAVTKKTGCPVSNIRIRKESIDARRKPDVKLVYTLDFSCDKELDLPVAKTTEYQIPVREKPYIGKHPVVAGFGPSGMFAALILAEAGLKPIVIERGEEVDKRVETVEKFWKTGKLNPESNVQFGEGGAGTFSDGKLTTGIKDIRISKVLREFVEAGADGSILYKNKPHIGTDKLREIVKNIRYKITALGGEVRFNTRLEQVILDNSNKGSTADKQLKAVVAGGSTIETDTLVLAIGHSAYDTFTMLYEQGQLMEQKQFSIGVRIEHPQEMINRVQYGDPKLADLLGPADYKLNHRCQNGRGVYTFCMCPGGVVVDSSSELETAVTNGMSYSARDGEMANSGLLVDVRKEDFGSEHPLAGFQFQRKYERLAYINGGGKLPKTTYGSFRTDKKDPVASSLPEFAVNSIVEAMPYLARKLRGFDDDSAIMTGIEGRSSSPVRVLRDENYQSSIGGIMPAGEGPGYAGGIMSAAVDGIKVAEKIIMR